MDGPAPSSVHVDGSWFTPGEPAIPADDRGFLYGDGVFESLRARGGEPVHLDAHLERLAASAAAVGIEGVPARAAIADTAREAVRRCGVDDAYVRITLTRGASGAFDPERAGAARLVVVALAPPPPPPAGGVTVALLPPAPLPDMPPPQVKSTAGFLRQTLGRRRARTAGFDDAVWRDPDANVTEATSSNVFAVKGARVHTPPATVCLPGITRAVVLRAARALGLATSTAPMPTRDLLAADEVFITNSVAGVVPVRRVAGVDFEPGPVTRELAEVSAETS